MGVLYQIVSLEERPLLATVWHKNESKERILMDLLKTPHKRKATEDEDLAYLTPTPKKSSKNAVDKNALKTLIPNDDKSIRYKKVTSTERMFLEQFLRKMAVLKTAFYEFGCS